MSNHSTHKMSHGWRAMPSLFAMLWLLVVAAGSGCADASDNASAPKAQQIGGNTGNASGKKRSANSSTDGAQGTSSLPDTTEGYVYSSTGKRDPFLSYLNALRASSTTAQEEQAVEDTERFELDQYKLTGLLTGGSKPMALVEDPEKRGHVLRIGSPLGKNGGRITRITSKEIVVMEEFKDPKGQRIRVPYTITLRPDMMTVNDASSDPMDDEERESNPDVDEQPPVKIEQE